MTSAVNSLTLTVMLLGLIINEIWTSRQITPLAS